MGHFSKERAPEKYWTVIDEFNEKKIMGETGKAHDRRVKENWFYKYAPFFMSGLDIGCGEDPLNDTFRRWDQKFGDGDAEEMEGVPNRIFRTVYASHILEHVRFPVRSIKRWFELVHTGGHLIVIVPHRDLYEKKRILPSNWNEDHKHFFLPEESDLPCTLNFKQVILEAIPDADLCEFRVIDEGYQRNGDDKHSTGEYSIEAVIKKNAD